MDNKTLDEMPEDMRDLNEGMKNEKDTRWVALLHKVVSRMAFRLNVSGSIGKWLKANRSHWSDS